VRVLVTGATGSIGPHLIRRLAPGNEVFAISRHVDPELDRVEWIRPDLSRPLDHAALPGGVDAVAHLAQSERYRDFPDGATDLFAVNVRSTASLLEYARGAGARASRGHVTDWSRELLDSARHDGPGSRTLLERAAGELARRDAGATLGSLIPEPARNG
jgi:UDP-glucose 4-epimerase